MGHWVLRHNCLGDFYTFGLAVFLHLLKQRAPLNILQHLCRKGGVGLSSFLVEERTLRISGSLRHVGLKNVLILVCKFPCRLLLPDLSCTRVDHNLAWSLPPSLRFCGIWHGTDNRQLLRGSICR